MIEVAVLVVSLFSQISSANVMLDSKEIPAPTFENLKVSILPDDWRSKDEYLAKGKYFRVDDSFRSDIAIDGLVINKFDVYSDVSLKPPVMLSVSTPRSIYKDNIEVCREYSSVEDKVSDTYLMCKDGGCKEVNLPGNQNSLTPFSSLKSEMKKSKDVACPYKIDFVAVNRFLQSDESAHVLFRYNKVSADKKSLEITVNGKVAYLDIRECQLGSSPQAKGCEEVVIPNSQFEESWMKLKTIKSNKSHENLNRAIKLITPCLKNKDVKCVEKYITRYGEADPESFTATDITYDVLNELKHCLNYESLLPSLKASKGVKKVCVFNDAPDDKPLRGVTYIEALSVEGKTIEVNAR